MVFKIVFHFAILITCLFSSAESTRRPIIGLLMQKASSSNQYVIFANYVKALEGAGAEVVPIWINRDPSYYRNVMISINGLVIPGGDANLLDPTDIGGAANELYQLAEKMNDAGNYFPILGVCQGFELMATISAGMKSVLTPCSGVGYVNLPLKFVVDPSDTKFFKDAFNDTINILKTEAVTANVHWYCVTEGTLKQFNLTSSWRVLSLDKDKNGLEFITTMEHYRYPFAGVQFHPEKPIYSIAGKANYANDYKSILANRWFYDWIVIESSKNNNTFQGSSDDLIMDNYCPKLERASDGLAVNYYFNIPDDLSVNPRVELLSSTDSG